MFQQLLLDVQPMLKYIFLVHRWALKDHLRQKKHSKHSPSDITKDNPVKILKAAFGISLSNIVSTACNNPSKCFESSRRQDVQSRFNDSEETNWKSFLQLFSIQMFKMQSSRYLSHESVMSGHKYKTDILNACLCLVH